MSEKHCHRHPEGHPCTCAMGNLYRFVEPVLLFLLKRKGQSYGYELAGEVGEFALTDAEVDAASLYRTLRSMEKNGCVASSWDVEHNGPARRLYRLTAHGEAHLAEWLVVLGQMSRSMARLVEVARETNSAAGGEVLDFQPVAGVAAR
jgi:DNA-binding PadR family transcriptional regulator